MLGLEAAFWFGNIRLFLCLICIGGALSSRIKGTDSSLKNIRSTKRNGFNLLL